MPKIFPEVFEDKLNDLPKQSVIKPAGDFRIGDLLS